MIHSISSSVLILPRRNHTAQSVYLVSRLVWRLCPSLPWHAPNLLSYFCTWSRRLFPSFVLRQRDADTGFYGLSIRYQDNPHPILLNDDTPSIAEALQALSRSLAPFVNNKRVCDCLRDVAKGTTYPH